MTPAQLAVAIPILKPLVAAEPSLANAVLNGQDNVIAAWLNSPASPSFFVTKTELSRHDILTGTSSDGTTFTWTGAAYITRAQGERDAFREMFNSTGTVNPSLPSITAAFNDIFSGAGGAVNRTHITAMSKRLANRMEKALSTTPGTGTSVSPATLTVVGEISVGEAGLLR